MNFLQRFTNWKMTLFGTGIGAAFASVAAYILVTQAHCDFAQVSWVAVLTFAGSQVVGAVGTDNGQGV